MSEKWGIRQSQVSNPLLSMQAEGYLATSSIPSASITILTIILSCHIPAVLVRTCLIELICSQLTHVHCLLHIQTRLIPTMCTVLPTIGYRPRVVFPSLWYVMYAYYSSYLIQSLLSVCQPIIKNEVVQINSIHYK